MSHVDRLQAASVRGLGEKQDVGSSPTKKKRETWVKGAQKEYETHWDHIWRVRHWRLRLHCATGGLRCDGPDTNYVIYTSWVLEVRIWVCEKNRLYKGGEMRAPKRGKRTS